MAAAYPTVTVDSATQACLPIASDACLAGPTAGAPRLEALRELAPSSLLVRRRDFRVISDVRSERCS